MTEWIKFMLFIHPDQDLCDGYIIAALMWAVLAGGVIIPVCYAIREACK